MPLVIVDIASLVLQIAAVVLALSLIRVTNRRLAWCLIAAALLLMAVRRAIPIIRELEGAPEMAMDAYNTIVGLIISILMIIGIERIRPVFLAIKRTEEGLRESELRFRSLIENAPEGIYVQSGDRFVYVNPAFMDILGASSKEELLGTEFLVRIAPEYHEAIRQRIRSDGERVPVETTAIPVRWQGQNAHLVLARDISERKRAESEATRAATLRDYLSRYANDSIILLDEKYRFLEVNERTVETYGYAREELIGMHASQLRSPETRGAFNGQIDMLKHADSALYETVHQAKDGRVFPVQISLHTVTIYGKRLYQAVIRDITDHKRVQDERIAREAAEEATRIKSQFVANMSHEIRTPLNAILGFAQILERDPTLTPAQAGHVRTITRGGEHLLHLINDILDISRLEAGKTSLNEAPFNPRDLVNDLGMMFRSRAAGKGLELLIEQHESVPDCAAGDEGKLRQIYINLMGNAVKFTQAGGVAVRVRAENTTGPDGAPAVRLISEIEDSGPGISEKDMAVLFQTFQQAESGLRTGGTGLGLAISRKFAELMGGDLTVTSRLGTGSCFRFSVLLKPAESTPGKKTAATRRVTGVAGGADKYRVLVVDDTAENRAFLCELLRPVGFDVTEAANGAEALEIFDKLAPHVVLMDMRMPVMDGYEATRRLKTTERGRATPIIAVTASAFDDSRKEVLRAGVNDYLRKPFRAEELFDLLTKHLGLTYVFDETVPAADRQPGHTRPPTAPPVNLPRELVSGILKAVEEGDMVRLAELIARVEKVDKQTAGQLRSLADRYDYDHITEWLKKGGAADAGRTGTRDHHGGG